jgi:hypothetical protein
MKSESFRLIALVLSGLAFAQAPRKAEASLQLLSGGEYITDHGYLQSNGQVRPIDISPDLLSERISYAGPARFEIRPISGKGSKKDGDAPLAWIDLPEGGPHRLILIINPRPGTNGISAINDSPGALPFGSMRFFNACDYPVELAGGSFKLSVRPHSSALLKPDVKDGHYLDLDVFTLDGEPRNVFHLRQFYMIDARTLVFIEPDGPEGQARVKSFEERDVQPPALKPDSSPPRQLPVKNPNSLKKPEKR